jgi:diaminopimelate epimerase
MDVIGFLKYSGLGNDFVIVDNRKLSYSFSSRQIQLISDRKFGVGCDQFILLEKSDKGDVRMRTFNADGSEAEICGNAARCVASMIIKEKNKREIKLQTNNRLVYCKCINDELFSVNMGKPCTIWHEIPILRELDIDNVNLDEFGLDEAIFESASVINAGNPQCILFLKNKNPEYLENFNIREIGKMVEGCSLFPDRVNVTFIQVLSRDKVNIKIWERGAGETLASGSGSCAVQASCYRKGLTNSKVEIKSKGGSLFIEINESGEVIMTGAVLKVFDGTIDSNLFKNRGL